MSSGGAGDGDVELLLATHDDRHQPCRPCPAFDRLDALMSIQPSNVRMPQPAPLHQPVPYDGDFTSMWDQMWRQLWDAR